LYILLAHLAELIVEPVKSCLCVSLSVNQDIPPDKSLGKFSVENARTFSWTFSPGMSIRHPHKLPREIPQDILPGHSPDKFYPSENPPGHSPNIASQKLADSSFP